jgi:hypothetical protein
MTTIDEHGNLIQELMTDAQRKAHIEGRICWFGIYNCAICFGSNSGPRKLAFAPVPDAGLFATSFAKLSANTEAVRALTRQGRIVISDQSPTGRINPPEWYAPPAEWRVAGIDEINSDIKDAIEYFGKARLGYFGIKPQPAAPAEAIVTVYFTDYSEIEARVCNYSGSTRPGIPPDVTVTDDPANWVESQINSYYQGYFQGLIRVEAKSINEYAKREENRVRLRARKARRATRKAKIAKENDAQALERAYHLRGDSRGPWTQGLSRREFLMGGSWVNLPTPGPFDETFSYKVERFTWRPKVSNDKG